MTKSILLATLAFVGASATAATKCLVNRENPKQEMVFDQNVFSEDVSQPRKLCIKKDGSLLKDFDFEKDLPDMVAKNGLSKVKAEFDGAIMVAITPQDGNIAIGTSHFDFKKKVRVLRPDAVVIGDPTRVLNLFDGYNRIGVYCTNQ